MPTRSQFFKDATVAAIYGIGTQAIQVWLAVMYLKSDKWMGDHMHDLPTLYTTVWQKVENSLWWLQQ